MSSGIPANPAVAGRAAWSSKSCCELQSTARICPRRKRSKGSAMRIVNAGVCVHNLCVIKYYIDPYLYTSVGVVIVVCAVEASHEKVEEEVKRDVSLKYLVFFCFFHILVLCSWMDHQSFRTILFGDSVSDVVSAVGSPSKVFFKVGCANE